MKTWSVIFLFSLMLSSCGGNSSSSQSEECSYYNKRVRKEAFTGVKTQAIQSFEQSQAQCSSSSGGLDIGQALTSGAGLNSQSTTECVARQLREFRKTRSCK